MSHVSQRFPEMDYQFTNLLRTILAYGEDRGDRTGTGTKSVFAPGTISIDLRKVRGEYVWPATTLRKINPMAPVVEQLWVLQGRTNERWLAEHGVGYWKSWADTEGNLGPVYGAQLRDYGASHSPEVIHDQLLDMATQLQMTPMSRRICATMWNPLDLEEMALPPCHGCFIQFYSREDKTLDLMMAQRSCDTMIGLPYNICQYALFLYLMCEISDHTPGKLYISLGDAHIYNNHIEAARDLLPKAPKQMSTISIPKIGCVADIGLLEPTDFAVSEYVSHPAVSLKVSV